MAEDKFLNIIAFDVPYPPNYGGICDVFYKLKHLHAQGAKIIYHCFYYEGHNPPTEELKQYCEELYFYERKKSPLSLLFSSLPYIISSRNNKELLDNLLKNDYPILFDGIQCCYYLNHPEIKKRFRIFRANNIEHAYYAGLAGSEQNSLKRLYLKREASKLEKFEKKLKGVDAILSVAKMDIPHFEAYGPTHHLPPFFKSNFVATEVPQNKVQKQVLFQGNLEVKENENAARYIIGEIAPLTSQKIVIAGKSPSSALKKLAEGSQNVTLIDTPSQEKMEELIECSQLNLLLTFQQTGIKLKLLNALESGQHIIINSFMDDSGIFSEMCEVADGAEDIAKRIDELMDEAFSLEVKKERHAKFKQYYDNDLNARKILDLI
jgi:hypothetical protein